MINETNINNKSKKISVSIIIILINNNIYTISNHFICTFADKITPRII